MLLGIHPPSSCVLLQFRQAKTEIVTASRVAYRFLAGVASNTLAAPESPGNSGRASPRIQGAWFKNLMTVGAKPSSSNPQLPGDEAALPQEGKPDGQSRRGPRDEQL